MVHKFTCTNTSVQIGRRLTTRTATAWTIGARISVELEETTEPNIQTGNEVVVNAPASQSGRLAAGRKLLSRLLFGFLFGWRNDLQFQVLQQLLFALIFK